MVSNDILSLKLIMNDFNDLISLIKFTSKTRYAPIFSLGIMPYVSFCLYEGIRFIERYSDIRDNIANYDVIKKSRLHIKIFDKSLSKSLNTIRKIDYFQHLRFSNIVSNKVKLQNLYNNLGIYYNPCGKIIFNTHLSSYFISPLIFEDRTQEEIQSIYLEGKINDNLNNEFIKNNTEHIGSYLVSIFDGINKADSTWCSLIKTNLEESNFKHIPYNIEYKDYNTNICFGGYNKKEIKREIILLVIHLISILNFNIYLLDEIIQKDNGIGVRIKYIAFDYVTRIISKLMRYFESKGHVNNRIYNTLSNEIINSNKLLNKSFGTHMRHYGITNDIFILSESDFWEKFKRPLVGLVEFYYKDTGIGDFESRLNKIIYKLSVVLESCVLLSRNNRKKL